MKLVLSTLSAPQKIIVNLKDGKKRVIFLKGGANVIDRKTLITPQGVITELSDEDYALLVSTDFWKRQEKGGYLRPVETKDAAEDTAKAGMKKKDRSAQKNKHDYGENAPVTGESADKAE